MWGWKVNIREEERSRKSEVRSKKSPKVEKSGSREVRKSGSSEDSGAL